MQETQVQSLGQPDPWRREWQPTPVFLPGEFYEQRSLAGYCPWGRKELDMTERLTVACLIHYSFINPNETITFENYVQQISKMHQKLHHLQQALVIRMDPILHNNS